MEFGCPRLECRLAGPLLERGEVEEGLYQELAEECGRHELQVVVQVREPGAVVVRWRVLVAVDIHPTVGGEYGVAALQTNYSCHNKA